MTRVSRRTLLRGLAGGVSGPLLLRAAPPVTVLPLAAACTTGRDVVQIVVVWSGRELEMFRRVLDTWKDRPLIQLISVGNGIESLLTSRIKAENPPHIAVLSQLRMLKDLQTHLYWLDPETVLKVEAYTPLWWQNLLTVGETPYGVWLKATHKSVFWHRLSTGLSPPDSLAKLTNWLAGHDARQSLGIGAADGWVLTDWFENALLGANSVVYRGLAEGTHSWDSLVVYKALKWLGSVWSIEGVLVHGPQRALLTQYDEAAVQVLGAGSGAGLTFEGDFVGPALYPYQQEGLVEPELGTFRFPPLIPGGRQPLLVGGDFAVRFKTRNERTDADAGRVVDWLAGREAAHRFAEYGFLTVHKGATKAEYLKELPGDVPRGSNLPELFAKLACQLREPTNSDIGFDLSDQLTGRLAGGDGQGIWQVLQEFFAEVTHPGSSLEEVVEGTWGRLIEAGKARDQ